MSATASPRSTCADKDGEQRTSVLSNFLSNWTLADNKQPSPILGSAKFGLLKTVTNSSSFDVSIYHLYDWGTAEASAHLLLPCVPPKSVYRIPIYIPRMARVGVRLNTKQPSTGEPSKECNDDGQTPTPIPCSEVDINYDPSKSILDCGPMKESMSLYLS